MFPEISVSKYEPSREEKLITYLNSIDVVWKKGPLYTWQIRPPEEGTGPAISEVFNMSEFEPPKIIEETNIAIYLGRGFWRKMLKIRKFILTKESGAFINVMTNTEPRGEIDYRRVHDYNIGRLLS